MNDRNSIISQIRDALGSACSAELAGQVYDAMRADRRIDYVDDSTGLAFVDDSDLEVASVAEDLIRQAAEAVAAKIETALGVAASAHDDGSVYVRVTVDPEDVDDEGCSKAGTRAWGWLQEQGYQVTDNSADSQAYLDPGVGRRYDHVYVVESRI